MTLLALAAVLAAVAGALILLHLSNRPRSVAPPAHPRRRQQAMDDMGDEGGAVLFDFPDRPDRDPAA